MTTVPRYILFEPSKDYLPTPSQEANAYYLEQGTYAFVVETRDLYFNEPSWDYVNRKSRMAKQIPASVLASLTLLDWIPYAN